MCRLRPKCLARSYPSFYSIHRTLSAMSFASSSRQAIFGRVRCFSTTAVASRSKGPPSMKVKSQTQSLADDTAEFTFQDYTTADWEIINDLQSMRDLVQKVHQHRPLLECGSCAICQLSKLTVPSSATSVHPAHRPHSSHHLGRSGRPGRTPQSFSSHPHCPRCQPTPRRSGRYQPSEAHCRNPMDARFPYLWLAV